MGAERQACAGDCGIDNRMERVESVKKLRNVRLYANVKQEKQRAYRCEVKALTSMKICR